MARILANARLKYDYVSLKGLLASHRVCQGCDLYALEDIHHLVIQCPGFYDIRIQMYEDIFSLNGDIPRKFSMRGCFHGLGGGGEGCMEGVGNSDQRMLWKVSGMAVLKCIQKTPGIGMELVSCWHPSHLKRVMTSTWLWPGTNGARGFCHPSKCV